MDLHTYPARGPAIPDSVWRLIGKIHDENRYLVAKEVMQELHKRLQKKNEQLRPDWPGLSAVQKELTRIRKNDNQVDLEDRPWSLESLEDYPIPPDALPIVLESMILFSKTRRSCFTIRQAKWVARLYRTIADLAKLTNAAEIYAADERVTKLTGIREDELMANVGLYSQMTGKTIVISLPISKSPIEIKHMDDDDPEDSGDELDVSANPDVKWPYVIEVKE